MADEDTTPDDGASAEAVAASVRDPGSLRQRVGRARFRSQVRDGLEHALKERSKKKTAGFRASEVPGILEHVTDADIDQAADRSAGYAAGDVIEYAQGDPGNKSGPIRDWFAAHPELVQAVVAALLKALLGA